MFYRLAKQGVEMLEDRATTTNSYRLIFNGYREKRLGLEAVDSSPRNFKVMNKWRCPSVTHRTCFHTVHRHRQHSHRLCECCNKYSKPPVSRIFPPKTTS